jgi:hypothetical protein
MSLMLRRCIRQYHMWFCVFLGDAVALGFASILVAFDNLLIDNGFSFYGAKTHKHNEGLQRGFII